MSIRASSHAAASRFDLVVIGSAPAGLRGAISASQLGRQVAIVDRTHMLGGVCVHTGTIPSKTLREAILYLSGYRERAVYGTLEYFRDAVFNDPTMAEAYKVAAADGLSKL